MGVNRILSTNLPRMVFEERYYVAAHQLYRIHYSGVGQIAHLHKAEQHLDPQRTLILSFWKGSGARRRRITKEVSPESPQALLRVQDLPPRQHPLHQEPHPQFTGDSQGLI